MTPYLAALLWAYGAYGLSLTGPLWRKPFPLLIAGLLPLALLTIFRYSVTDSPYLPTKHPPLPY